MCKAVEQNDIKYILNKLKGTCEEEILKQMQQYYLQIAEKQDEWYKKSNFYCPEGCGECCRNFEPDLLDCEALFMAAWLLENQKDIAEQVSKGIFPYPDNKGCPFWDEKASYHCTIYGGRPFICRFFGACGSKSKDEKEVFKPCKFYPAKKLAEHKPPLEHRQYTESEIQNIFGALPPVMSDFMEGAVSLTPDNHSTRLLREVLPDTIIKIMWLCSMT